MCSFNKQRTLGVVIHVVVVIVVVIVVKGSKSCVWTWPFRCVFVLGRLHCTMRSKKGKRSCTFYTFLLYATQSQSFRLNCKQVLNNSVVVTRQQPLPSAQRGRDGKGLVSVCARECVLHTLCTLMLQHTHTHTHVSVCVGAVRAEDPHRSEMKWSHGPRQRETGMKCVHMCIAVAAVSMSRIFFHQFLLIYLKRGYLWKHINTFSLSAESL